MTHTHSVMSSHGPVMSSHGPHTLEELTVKTAKHWLIFSGSLGRQCCERAIM